MDNRDSKNNRLTIDKKMAVLAALPPLIFGTGIAFGALIIWKPWYQVAPWRLYVGFAVFVLFTAVIFAGGAWAVRKRLPAWGYSWAGAGMMSVVMALKMIAEERADVGLAIINPTMDTILALFLVLSCVVLLFFAALRGWQAAGLVSIGFVTILTLSIIPMTTAAPFNRYDIALLSAPVGILIAGITYLYSLKDDRTRIVLLVFLEIVDCGAVWLVDRIWMESLNRSSSFWPFFVVVTLALLIGPVGAVALEWFLKLFIINKKLRSGEI